MKLYKAVFEETIEYEILVLAENEEEAKEKAEKMYDLKGNKIKRVERLKRLYKIGDNVNKVGEEAIKEKFKNVCYLKKRG